MTSKLWLDDETFSPEPITNGTHRYAESAEVMIRALALDDGLVQIRDLTPGGQYWTLIGGDIEPSRCGLTDDINAAIPDDQVEVWAHNSHFDRTVERHAGLQIPLHRWRDTMVQAMCHGLPGALGALSDIVLKLPADKQKDKEGKALIQLFCKPIPFRYPKMQPFRAQLEGESSKEYKAAKAQHKADYIAGRDAAQANWPGRATRETHPAEWRRFLIYAGQDIEAMRAAHSKMPTWNYRDTELALWHLDQRINDRGVAVDVALAECAVNAVEEAQVVLRERTVEATRGEVESATKRDALLLHVLAEYGVDLPDLQKATLERRIADPDLPEGLRELLRIRLAASTTSTSKYKTLIRATSSDGRLRGLLQFCGAGRTGRWAGRLWQPQNLPRPNMKQSQIDMGIDALMAGCAAEVFDDVMRLTSNVIRGCIIAPPGKKLVVADLSNIEGRGLAWLAGERWKLKAFYAFDAGTGHDLYKLSYAKSFGVRPEDVTKDQRQIGKVQELALGYEGGVGAFVTFAAAYGIDLEKLAETAQRAIPGDVWGRANIMLEWHRKKGRDPAHALGLSERAWLVCESFKLGWRDAHPNVVALWKDLDSTVRAAITQPGKTFICGVLKVRRDGAWLRIVLPSGRAICYPSPALVPEKKTRKLQEWDPTEDQLDETGRTVITYMGLNQYSRKWERLTTYGGKLVENCIAKGTEVLTEAGWLPIELTAGYRVWDGVEWVAHAGCVYKGKQVVLTAYGVTMTPDHQVLTVEGWKNASSCAGYNRAEVRLPGSHPLYRIGERTPIYVGSAVPVRHAETHGSIGIPQAAEAGDNRVVRLHAARDHRRAQNASRHDIASGVLGVAQYGGSLPPGDAPGVSQLWCAGYRGVCALARIVRKLLGRHGAGLPDRAHAGASQERRGLQPDQLRMAQSAPAVEQQAHVGVRGDATGPHDDQPGSAPVQHRPVHTGLATVQRLEPRARLEPVYDLIDCGPRNRFVVRGADGRALIVHNCTQAAARDVMAANMPTVEAEMYEIVLSVHDELITEAPDHEDWNDGHLASIMATVPEWAPGLPLAAAGFEAYRYRKD